MSTVAITGIVAIGLFVLVAIAVAVQTVEKNKKEKRRLHAGLTGKARNFQHMLAGFPEGFLNNDLQTLVCKSLLQVYEQLSEMEPSNKEYARQIQAVKQQLQQLKNKPAQQQTVALTDNAQIKEVQKLLKGLFNFISKLTENRKLSVKEAKAYAKQIRRLMIQTSLDSLSEAKRQALQAKKHRLAIHYLQMSIEKMKKENGDGYYTNAITQLDAQINQLNEQALKNEQVKKERMKNNADEWDELNKDDDSWKKKAIYD